jgi:hypothetical protein
MKIFCNSNENDRKKKLKIFCSILLISCFVLIVQMFILDHSRYMISTRKEHSFSDLSRIGSKNSTLNHTTIIEVFRDLEVLKDVRDKIKIKGEISDEQTFFSAPLKKFEKTKNFLSDFNSRSSEYKYNSINLGKLLNAMEENEDTEILLNMQENIEIF